MPYEFNPLIPDGFQKKSDVTPADISRVESEISDLQTTTTDLKQKKVTKFFSANDYLEDNEIAQYQGEDDAVNNLTNGFFYKKNPAFIITQNGDSFSYLTGRKINWFLRDNTLKVSQYYLTTINSDYNDFHFAYDSGRDIEVLFFAETYAKSPALKPAVSQGTLYYPFAIVNNQFDYNNPIQIIGNDYYYKGVIIHFTQSSGGVSAILCASMEAPFYRYLWLPVIMRGGTFWYAAFLYETNSNNEFVILGVDNNLSAFDICRDEYEYIVPAMYINVQGFDLTVNPVFSAVDSMKVNLPFFVANPGYITQNQNFVFTFSSGLVRYYECIFFLVANSGAGNEIALLRIGHGDSWNARFIKLDGTDDFGTPSISVSSHTAQVSFPITITGSSKISIMPLSGVNILSYNIL